MTSSPYSLILYQVNWSENNYPFTTESRPGKKEKRKKDQDRASLIKGVLAFYKEEVLQAQNYTKKERHRKGKSWLCMECFCNKNCYLEP
jgi:hypothetical protein